MALSHSAPGLLGCSIGCSLSHLHLGVSPMSAVTGDTKHIVKACTGQQLESLTHLENSTFLSAIDGVVICLYPKAGEQTQQGGHLLAERSLVQIACQR